MLAHNWHTKVGLARLHIRSEVDTLTLLIWMYDERLMKLFICMKCLFISKWLVKLQGLFWVPLENSDSEQTWKTCLTRLCFRAGASVGSYHCHPDRAYGEERDKVSQTTCFPLRLCHGWNSMLVEVEREKRVKVSCLTEQRSPDLWKPGCDGSLFL